MQFKKYLHIENLGRSEVEGNNTRNFRERIFR